MDQEVRILRYGHRHIRDYRVTTHCCLASRALGAKGIIIEGDQDPELKKTLEGLKSKWGKKFELDYTNTWTSTLKEYKKKGYSIVHLTMKGSPVQEKIEELRQKNKILAIIGSKKVEPRVYKESDYNIAIGKQPHSEISALAVFLYMLLGNKIL